MLQRHRTRLPLEVRFWRHVCKGNGCWGWTGATTVNGYGRIGVFDPVTDYPRTVAAHRIAYELEVGSVPAGLDLCHRCDNRRCVRPSHLFIGTRKDNMQDALRKGRINIEPARTKMLERTHCNHGHVFSEENTIWRHDARGYRWRNCRTCKHIADAAQRAKRRERVA